MHRALNAALARARTCFAQGRSLAWQQKNLCRILSTVFTLRTLSLSLKTPTHLPNSPSSGQLTCQRWRQKFKQNRAQVLERARSDGSPTHAAGVSWSIPWRLCRRFVQTELVLVLVAPCCLQSVRACAVCCGRTCATALCSLVIPKIPNALFWLKNVHARKVHLYIQCTSPDSTHVSLISFRSRVCRSRVLIPANVHTAHRTPHTAHRTPHTTPHTAHCTPHRSVWHGTQRQCEALRWREKDSGSKPWSHAYSESGGQYPPDLNRALVCFVYGVKYIDLVSLDVCFRTKVWGSLPPLACTWAWNSVQ